MSRFAWLALLTVGSVLGTVDSAAAQGTTLSTGDARWTGAVDAMFLHRSDPSSGILAVNTDTPSEQFKAHDFDFGTHTGFDVTLSRSVSHRRDLQLRYFEVDGWEDTQSIATTFNELLRFNASPPVFVVSGDAISSTYRSRLHNAEISTICDVYDWLSLSSGFRYLELSEFGTTSLVNAAVPYTYEVNTRNFLYGGQAGMLASLWYNDRISIDINGKAGIYGNHSRHRATSATNVATVTAAGSDDRAAFCGELAIQGMTRVTGNLSFRVGYRLLWLDGVAVATDQLAVSNFNNGTGFDGSGDAFFQGAYVGIELHQ